MTHSDGDEVRFNLLVLAKKKQKAIAKITHLNGKFYCDCIVILCTNGGSVKTDSAIGRFL